MRNQLEKEILIMLMGEDIDTSDIRNKLVMILDKYEVQERCTELVVCEEDEIEKYVRLFLVNKKIKGCTDRTLKHYKDTLRRFFEEVPKNPTTIEANDIKMYLAKGDIEKGWSKTNQKNALRVISSFYTWMMREEFITKNPMNKIDEIKIPKVKKKAFSEAELELMRLAIGDNLLMKMIFELLLSTWCRVSELTGMKLTDFDEDYRSVVVHGKGQKDRICYINDVARIHLKNYLSYRKDASEYLIPKFNEELDWRQTSKLCKEYKVKQRDWWKEPRLVGQGIRDKSCIEGMLRQLGKKAKVKDVHPHRFRRTGATMALKRGMPIQTVSKLLGHESLETTQIYLDLSEDDVKYNHNKYV